MLKIIALDPGVTTGYAEGVINDEGFMKVRCGQAAYTHLDLYEALRLRTPDFIVCESFEFRKLQQGVNYYPVEMIGVVNLYVQTREKQDTIYLYMQPPSTQGDKAHWTDSKLKESNVYRPGVPHGRSALKHLLYWYEFGAGYKYNKKGFGPWDE